MKNDTLIKSYAFLARDIAANNGNHFIYDKLEIIYSNKCVTVYYEGNPVLIFDYDNKESFLIKYQEGNWTKLLVEIHQNILELNNNHKCR